MSETYNKEWYLEYFKRDNQEFDFDKFFTIQILY